MRSVVSIFSSKRWSAVLVGIVFAALYGSTMPRTNVGYADSDVLLAAAYQGGVAHPPGYPVYMALLYGAMHLPIPGLSPTELGHALSIVFGVTTVAIVFLTVWELYSVGRAPKNNSFVMFGSPAVERWFVAVTTSALVGTTYGFWLYSQMVEKYAMSACVAAGVVYSLVRVLVANTKKVRGFWWVVAMALLGLGLAHQQTIVFLLPMYIYVYFSSNISDNRHDSLKGLLLMGGLFGLSYLLAFLMQSVNPSVSWSFDPTLEGLLDMVLRRPFAGTRYATGEMVSAYWGGIDIAQSMTAIHAYGLLVYQHVGVLGSIFLGTSLVYGYFRRDRISVAVFLAALFLGPLLAAYIRWPNDVGTQAVTLRQYVPGFAMLALLASYGMRELIWRLGRLMVDIGIGASKASFVLVGVTSILFGMHVWKLYPQVDLSDYSILHDRYHDMLESFGEQAVVTCYSDISCFALMYEQSVHNMRPDVTIVPLAYQYVSQTIADPDLKGFNYPDNPFMNFDIVTWNLGKRPVYAVELNDYYYSFFGLNYPFMYYIPHQTYGEFSRKVPDELPQLDLTNSGIWLEYSVPPLDLMRQHQKATIARDLLMSALVYYKADDRPEAEEAMRRATSIYYSVETDQDRVDAVRSGMGQTRPLEEFLEGAATIDAAEFLERYAAYTDSKLPNRAYGAALGAVVQDPTNIEARLRLAMAYEELTDYRFAYIEYSHVLLLDPDNAEALEGQERMLVYRQ